VRSAWKDLIAAYAESPERTVFTVVNRCGVKALGVGLSGDPLQLIKACNIAVLPGHQHPHDTRFALDRSAPRANIAALTLYYLIRNRGRRGSRAIRLAPKCDVGLAADSGASNSHSFQTDDCTFTDGHRIGSPAVMGNQ
jgi:hypothetical protein